MARSYGGHFRVFREKIARVNQYASSVIYIKPGEIFHNKLDSALKGNYINNVGENSNRR
jgi:hypothetical protein